MVEQGKPNPTPKGMRVNMIGLLWGILPSAVWSLGLKDPRVKPEDDRGVGLVSLRR
jgi:hypothetical protein